VQAVLYSLRSLDLDDTPINQVPKGIGGLNSLNNLGGFPIGGGNANTARMQDGWNLEELGPLMQLRSLELSNLERAGPCSTDSLLVNKRYLKKLFLWCTESTDKPYSEDAIINIEKTFNLLIPAHNLEYLSFKDFFGRRFHTWLDTATSLPSLQYLNLIKMQIVCASSTNRLAPQLEISKTRWSYCNHQDWTRICWLWGW
jgi:hypothetical protein